MRGDDKKRLRQAIKNLRAQVRNTKGQPEDSAWWGAEEGCLISRGDAKAILKALAATPTRGGRDGE